MKISKRISVFTSICLLAIWISAFSCPAYGIAMPQGTPQIQSITWQDPQNAVLIWTHTEGTSYNIYRADTSNGAYSLVGMSSSGSYRDNTVDYPKEYFYKIQAISKDGIEGSLSAAMKVGTNPQHVSSVIVLMYHNFVSIEDRNAGILFDEYSISPQAFEEDLLYLKNNGYTTITSKDLIAYINGEKPLPSKANS